MSDQLIDESKIITGWCKESDGCPPGCTEEVITDYPIYPPSDLNSCSQGNSSWTRASFKIHKEELAVIKSGTNGIGFSIYDEDGKWLFAIGDAYEGTFNNCHQISGDIGYLFHYAETWNGGGTTLFRKSLTAPYDYIRKDYSDYNTLFVSVWNNSMYVSHGLVGIGTTYRLSGVEYNGVIFFNYELEYVGHYGQPTSLGGLNARYFNNKIYVLKGTTVEVRNPTTPYSLIKTITTPKNGYAIWDLGIYDGKGLYTMPAYRSQMLYDYDDNLIAVIENPDPLDNFGWCDNAGPSRYGNFILIGCPRASSNGFTANGALRIYDLKGRYIKTLANGEGPGAIDNMELGAGVALLKNHIFTSGSYNVKDTASDTSGYRKTCRYN